MNKKETSNAGWLQRLVRRLAAIWLPITLLMLLIAGDLTVLIKYHVALADYLMLPAAMLGWWTYTKWSEAV
jgi:hypothetical protein